MRLWDGLLDLLYPPKCVFCRGLLQREETEVCAACRKTLPRAEAEVKRSGISCMAVFYYEAPVAESLRRFKFRGQSHYAEAYGRLLAMELLRSGVEFDVLTWAPVSKRRRRKRGYDQTELLARAVAGELKVPCTRTLAKRRDNPPQSGLQGAAERRANVKGVYWAVTPELVADKRVLLIDDILTTGATLSECSFVLRAAGAAQVRCAALAATRSGPG